nr:RDD family protein [Mycobacterium sp. MFM001]
MVAETDTTPAVETAAPDSLARWHIRAAAFVVDVVPSVAVVATMILGWLAVPVGSAWWSLCIAVMATVILLTLINRTVWPANRGWSLGRALMGITVVRRDGTSAGVGRLLLRDLAHLLDTIAVFVGWLWPLWDSHRRTFADMLLRTEVRRVEADQRPAIARRLTAIVVATAAVLCAAGAALSFTVVFLHERATDQTRTAIQTQGPKIVAEMLTYDPKTLKDDFARARSLTTDKYRDQLAKQQEVVQKGQPVVNEYWVTNSAVKSATPDTAEMLLFLQGHRGGENQQRFITATVRVAFVKGPDSRWLVDDLTVVTKPKPAQGQK